ncbi:MAG: hypothetical protein ACYC8T_15425 [Myxococcaceae bacterium]
MKRETSLPLLVAAGLALARCQAALFDAISRAQEAEAKGDVVAAALSYREACRLGRKDAVLCARATEAARVAIERLVMDARAACSAHDVTGCLQAIRPARALSADPRITEMIDEAGRLHADDCEKRPLVRPVDAVVLVRCVESRAGEVPTAAYRLRVSRTRTKAARWLALTGAAATSLDQHGTAYALYGVAVCLGGEEGHKERREESKARFYERAVIPAWVAVRGEPSTIPELVDYCLRLEATGRLPAAVRCDRTAPAPRLDLRVDAARHALVDRAESPAPDAASDGGAGPAGAPAQGRRWESDWTAQLQVQGGKSRPMVSESGSIAAEREPAPSYFDDELATRLGALIAKVLSGEVKRRGAERLAECGRPTAERTKEWLQCWTEGTLWAFGDPAQPYLGLLEEAASDSDDGQPALPAVPCVK